MVSKKQETSLKKEEKQAKAASPARKTATKANRLNIRDLGLGALKNLPTTISLIQNFMKVVNWKEAQAEVLQGLNSTVVIVGLPNTGKSTLFNKIKGQQLSPVSSAAGTTRTLVRTDFGPFTLIDTPGHLPELMESGMKEASVIVFLLDATRGLQDKDKELYSAIKEMKKPTILAVNKVDALKGSNAGDQLAIEIANMLGAVGVIPVSARTGENIAEELIPAMIEASPEAALVIGHELPIFRRQAAQRIIRNATLLSLAAGLEPIPLVDIPILLGTQVRLVLRLAALYGEPLSTADGWKHARELIATIAGGLGMRYLAEQAAKAIPYGGDFVAGAIAGAGTWAIGQVALEYYDSGKQLNARRLRQLYTSFYRLFRKRNTPAELRQYAIEGADAQLLLEEPKADKEDQ